MIRGLLCDVHGVLYVHPSAIPGSPQALARLEETQFPYVLLTNSTQFPKRHILDSMSELGFPLDPERLLTAPQAAGSLFREQGVRRVGWLAERTLAEDVPDVIMVDPESRDAEPVEAVLVGDIGDRFTYRTLNRAFAWLQGGARLVALARNRFYATTAGLQLDSGPYVRLLEDAAGIEAVVTGKPSPAFFQAGLARLGLDPSEVAMVGDDLDFDVLPAMDLGMTGVLVQTGKYREEAYRSAPRKPDRLVPDLRTAVEFLEAGELG